MQNTKQNILQTLKIISLALILTTGLSIALAWNGPAAAPPTPNTDEPLNTSNNWQTKYGYLSLPKLIDSNDGQTGYYLDPGANSWLYRLYSYDIRSSIFYDQDNTDYYVDPASTSKFSTINLGGVSRSSWPSVPSGLCMFKFSGSCPSGWSRNSALDGRTIRGASTPGGTGGSGSHTHTTGSHTLTIAEMPSHRHRTGGPYGGGDVSRAYGEINQYAEVGQTSAVGGNQPHNHGNTGSTSSWPPYTNVIVCCKN